MDDMIKLADEWEQIELKRRFANIQDVIDRVWLAPDNNHIPKISLLGEAYKEQAKLKKQIKPDISLFFKDDEESQMELF
jgi:hypothetical protein